MTTTRVIEPSLNCEMVMPSIHIINGGQTTYSIAVSMGGVWGAVRSDGPFSMDAHKSQTLGGCTETMPYRPTGTQTTSTSQRISNILITCFVMHIIMHNTYLGAVKDTNSSIFFAFLSQRQFLKLERLHAFYFISSNFQEHGWRKMLVKGPTMKCSFCESFSYKTATIITEHYLTNTRIDWENSNTFLHPRKSSIFYPKLKFT